MLEIPRIVSAVKAVVVIAVVVIAVVVIAVVEIAVVVIAGNSVGTALTKILPVVLSPVTINCALAEIAAARITFPPTDTGVHVIP